MTWTMILICCACAAGPAVGMLAIGLVEKAVRG